MYKKKLLIVFILLITLSISGCSQDINNSDPVDVLNGYLSAENWEERLPYVKNRQNVNGLMEEYYGSKKFELSFNVIDESKKKLDDKLISLKALIDNREVTYYLEEIENEYKIKWKSVVGYNKKPWNTYKAEKPRTGETFRLIGKLDDYFNYYFRDKENSYYSIQLSESDWYYQNGHYVRSNAYIEKNSDKGKELFNILKDGKHHRLTLKIKPPMDKDGDVYHIVNFEEGWIIDIDKL